MRLVVLTSALAIVLSGCGPSSEPPVGPEPEGNADAPDSAASSPIASAQHPEMVAPVQSPDPSERSEVSATSLKPRIPLFNATCGGGIEVHANEGGPVFIDGEETSLKKFNENYFEATRDGTTIAISFNPDDSLSLSFTGPNRANGICTIK